MKAAFSLDGIKRMNNSILLEFLTDMVREIFVVGGFSLVFIRLIVILINRAGHLRGLTEDNLPERVTDLCYDTIKSQIFEELEKLLRLYCETAQIPMPSTVRIRDLAACLHHDAEALDLLLPILKNLTEVGLQSPEFQQVLLLL
jgi:hypothetical protein